jgi:photosystem II stability/assembly factor-like uncharacterized protein
MIKYCIKLKNVFLLSALQMLASPVADSASPPLKNISTTDWHITQMTTAPSLRASAILNGVIWVAGTNGKVFKSNDKGQSWNDVSIKTFTGDIRDLELIDSQTAIAMSVGSGKDSRLYRTTDAGANWKLLYSNTDEQGFFDSIDFWDNKNGLLLGDPVDGFYTIMKTRDGGKSWRRIAKNRLPKMRSKEAAFAASGNTLIITTKNQSWAITGGFSASAYFSNDRGENWKRMEVPLHSASQTSGGYALATNAKGDVFALGGDYLERAAKYPNLARLDKADATSHWRSVDAGQRGLRTAMTCQQQVCIMTGKTSSDISFDHGLNWQSFSKQGFYTLTSDKGLFVGAGHDGRVGIYHLH